MNFSAEALLALIVLCGLIATAGVICCAVQCVRYAIRIWNHHKQYREE